MFISKLTLNPKAFFSFGQYGSGRYIWHKAVWELFHNNPGQQRDFVYGLTSEMEAWMISERRPSTNDLVDVVAKPLDLSFNEGQVITMQSKANFRKTNYETDKHVGLFQREAFEQGVGLVGRLSRDCKNEVLREQLDLTGGRQGFRVLDSQLLNSEREAFYKGNVRMVYEVISFKARVEVTDPEAFRALIYQGMGAGKAFGLGFVFLSK